jgi:hypothetical protein
MKVEEVIKELGKWAEEEGFRFYHRQQMDFPYIDFIFRNYNIDKFWAYSYDLRDRDLEIYAKELIRDIKYVVKAELKI